MKFISRVSTINLADILPGGETKSGSSKWHQLPLETLFEDSFSFPQSLARLFTRGYFPSLSFIFSFFLGMVVFCLRGEMLAERQQKKAERATAVEDGYEMNYQPEEKRDVI